MGFVLIGLAVGILIDVRRAHLARQDGRYRPAFVFLVAPLAVMFILLGTMPFNSSDYKLVEHRKDIVAIADNTHLSGEISGGMFVISGSIDSKPVYSYYGRRGDGYVQEHVPTNRSIIYEDTKDTGYIEWTTCDPNMPFKWWEWEYSGCDTRTVSLESTLVGHYEIHVPSGSVVQGFNLDLNG